MEGTTDKSTNTPLFICAIFLSATSFSQAIYNSGLYLIPVMRAQFTFQSNIMLKVFLVAASASTLSFALLHAVGWKENLLKKERQHKVSNKVGLVGLIVGALLLGMGMNIAGACPGTLPIQVGSGFIPNGFITIVGAIVGGTVFLWLNPTLKYYQQLYDFTDTSASNSQRTQSYGTTNAEESLSSGLLQSDKFKHTIYNWVGCNALLARLSFACIFLSAAVLVDELSPGYGHLPQVDAALLKSLWSPYVCGSMIGFLQLPLMLTGGKHLGSTPTYITLSQMIGSAIPCAPSRMRLTSLAVDNIWELAYSVVAGTMTFVFAITLLPKFKEVDFPYDGSHDITFGEQFIGGALIAFGAKFASGCTSGHGISGMGHLRTKSFIAVAFMFVGGIAVSVARYLSGL